MVLFCFRTSARGDKANHFLKHADLDGTSGHRKEETRTDENKDD
jgi:hypothetical protein